MKTTVTKTTEADPDCLFASTSGAAVYQVKNASASDKNLCVQVPGLHRPGEYMTLEPGDTAILRLGFAGIVSVRAWQEEAGTVVALHGVVAVAPVTDRIHSTVR